MKKKQLNKQIYFILLAVVILFSAIAPTAVFANSASLYEYDCPACTDGVIIHSSDIACDIAECNNGSISITVSTDCSACTDGYTTTSCSVCSGNGWYIQPITSGSSTLGYLLKGCTNCGGSDSHSALSVNDLDYSEITIGTGYAICSLCTNGTIYTTTTTTCENCGGDGVVTEVTTTDCTECENGYLYCGIENISTISDVTVSAAESCEISFTYDVVGEIGNVDYYWYIDNTVYKITTEPCLTISGMNASTYEVYCKIVPSVGYIYDTNTFDITVTNSSAVGDIETSDIDLYMNIIYAVIAFVVIVGVGTIIIKRGK